MRELSLEQKKYAVKCLEQLVLARGLTQTHLEQLSRVKQSTISKMFSGEVPPSEEILRKLFEAIGLKLSDVLHELDALPDELVGYLATPLTGVVGDQRAERELRAIVERVRGVANGAEFDKPKFVLYWPGDHTHPTLNTEFTSDQVYRIDRSRASTYDFIILFCASPSFGVGQENEIATQAGVPAIRLLPSGISRMMAGSFVKAIDIQYRGTLQKGISFDTGELHAALKEIRKTHYQLRALYKNINGHGFGDRVRKLVDQRWGSYPKVAAELGISPRHLHALMEEPLAVSNPSALLLRRMAHLLGEKVGYLLGETDEIDAFWVESNASWRTWVDRSPGVDAAIALALRDEWRSNYRTERSQQSTASFRKTRKALHESDWENAYEERYKKVTLEKKRNLFN